MLLAVTVINFVLLVTLNNQAYASLQCYDCHGTRVTRDIRPEDAPFRNHSTGGFKGNHRRHLASGATPDACQKCHPGSTEYVSGHGNGTIKLSGNINSSVHPLKARYINSTSSGYLNYTSFPQTNIKTGRFFLGNCTNVNCHFENSTPVWGSNPFVSPDDCGRCHGAPPSGGVTGVAGSHVQHNAYYSGAAQCSKCHADHATFLHATSAARRRLIVEPKDPLGNPAGSYDGSAQNYLPSQSGTFGSCSSLYCHSNAAPFDKASSTATPVWGGAAQTCSSCHDSGGNATGLSGLHAKHTGGTYAFVCDRCHNETVDGNSSIKSTALHVNKSKDVTFKGGGTYTSGTRSCTATYCHSNGAVVKWSDTAVTMTCYSCHKGRTSDSTAEKCAAIAGVWSSARGTCTPDLTMSSNGHHRLVGPQWIRKYPCYYCHNNTIDASGAIKNPALHVNFAKDISMAPQWNIDGRGVATYNQDTKVCDNVYCHSDGTTDPEDVRPFAWTAPKTECNTCHGHPTGSCSNVNCHDGRTDANGKLWTVKTGWPAGSEWMGAMPMFASGGAGTARANSHSRHAKTDFTCDVCHSRTITGNCSSCHADGIPPGGMGEVAHIDAAYHVNKSKDVYFKDMPSAIYDKNTKTCSGTTCHTSGVDPVWGGSVNSAVTCLTCHGVAGSDVDDFNAFNGTQGKISTNEWVTSGHGRYSSAVNTGSYPKSGNRAANFPGNPCWYCHDNNILHKDTANPFRLRMHNQYNQRFEKECVYCHMEGTTTECLSCHVGQAESLSPQATGSGILYRYRDATSEIKFPSHTYVSGCINASCHDSDASRHKVNAGVWTTEQKEDVKNQYMMMGVCLQCHDDDSSNQCTSCHIAPAGNPMKYSLGFDPGTGFIKPKKARASAGHFGYKHYKAFKDSGGWTKDGNGKPMGTWMGGKFCWDCHDPHGDSNIFMIQAKVATTTDGTFGIPKTRSTVNFVNNGTGTDYARKAAPFDGICNVCHTPESKHYTNNSGDGHNTSRRCTTCHEHRFADSHANKQSCDSCHTSSKPVPKHTAFGLPRDCTKCHSGTVGKRMDVMGQMKSNSHHVQGVEVNNKHCYKCHWEATAEGLIDVQYHGGYNYKNYSSVKNDTVDLVIYGNGVRPAVYRNVSTVAGRATATTFLASNMGTSEERDEVGKITSHCVSCHSDQNNDTTPFDDCKTPRQYAWDLQSVASRYLQLGIATWGKYAGTPNAARKDITKSFSAHGNAVNNGGGFDPATGIDGTIPNTRAGSANVQCFDCHNSHGSKVVGVTSSYVTFNGTNNGANLKETKKGMGGYAEDYKAAANAGGVNPYSAGAGQCFDCHNTATAGTSLSNGKTPWGYSSTFGATAPVMGYKDTPRFGQDIKASTARFAERDSMKTIVGGHLKASVPPGSLPHLAKDSGTATAGSTTTLESSKSWDANALVNNFLLVESGSNSGQVRKILSNTASTLTTEPFASAILPGDTYQVVPYSTAVNGLCTPCHDPHGVSQTLGGNQAYALPLLKGTWMTSPYKEDAPPPDASGTNATDGATAGTKRSWGSYRWPSGGHPTPDQPSARYNLDRTTFGGSTRISEADDQFAGLCMNCHKKENLTDGTNKNQNFKTVDRVHESVKAWGANTEHSYTCSKCHQPHNSGLPRLMQTNCLDYKHRGGKASGGEYWSADSQVPSTAHNKGEHRGYPIANVLGNSASSEATSSCHAGAPLNSGTWPDKNLWNNVTPW
ncbi:MAG: cytochrome C [Geobacteraceae bacterium GWC2_53_11]|nr:MAG: cytochrome C [Geobacteraceae bacterium GWC2_53_11]